MQRLKSIGIAVAMLCLLCLIGFVNSSDADIEIVEIDAYGYAYSDGGISLCVYVETNEPYDEINFYLDGQWIGRVSAGNDVKTEAFFYSYVDDAAEGSVKGRTYTIRAEAWKENDWDPSDDTAYYYLTLYKPIVESGVKTPTWEKPRVTGAYGWVELLSRHYFDGTNIIMDGYVSAYNPTDEECRGEAWFRHTRADEAGFQEQHSAPTEDFDNGESYGPHSTDPMTLNFFVGGPIGDEDRYSFNAHIHLNVHGNRTTDTWEVDSTNPFDSEDNP